MSEPTADRDNWAAPYEVLRKRWHRVPAGGSFQILTGDMLCMTDVELMRVW
jgi:hypothetical protein